MKGREIYEKLSLAHDIYGKASSIEHSVVKSATKRIEEIEYTIAHPQRKKGGGHYETFGTVQ